MQGALKYLMVLVVSIPLLFALYTWAALSWAYSTGDRVGYIQKFSLKGWACKTWEGDLVLVTMPGTQAEKFFFTVRDEAVATKVNESLGKRVKLVYEEHRGLPSSCFGDTGYFVSDVQTLDEQTPAAH